MLQNRNYSRKKFQGAGPVKINKPIYVNDINDARYVAHQDSSDLYNFTILQKQLEKPSDYVPTTFLEMLTNWGQTLKESEEGKRKRDIVTKNAQEILKNNENLRAGLFRLPDAISKYEYDLHGSYDIHHPNIKPKGEWRGTAVNNDYSNVEPVQPVIYKPKDKSVPIKTNTTNKPKPKITTKPLNSEIVAKQKLIGVPQDGIWGPISQKAWDEYQLKNTQQPIATPQTSVTPLPTQIPIVNNVKKEPKVKFVDDYIGPTYEADDKTTEQLWQQILDQRSQPKKFGGKVKYKKYQSGSDDVSSNINNEKKFIQDWFNHPETKKRLESNLKTFPHNKFSNADDFIKDINNNLNTVKTVYSENPKDTMDGLIKYYSEKNPTFNKETIEQLAINDFKERGGSYDEETHTVLVNVPIKYNQAIAPHEYTHSTNTDKYFVNHLKNSTKFDEVNSNFEKLYGTGINYDTNKGLYSLKSKTTDPTLQKNIDELTRGFGNDIGTNFSVTAKLGKMGVDTKELGYINKSVEVYPRLMSIRRVGNLVPGQIVNKEMLAEIKAKMPQEKLFNYYSDEQIIEMLNTFADNNKVSYNSYAKYGGKFKKFQTINIVQNNDNQIKYKKYKLKQ